MATILDAARSLAWVAVCAYDDLEPDRGAALLVDGEQIALFRLGNGNLYAIDNRDPFSGANVLARGIVGSHGDAPKVASPMYKQTFDLRTGACFEDATVEVATHPVRVRDGWVFIGRP